MSRALLDTSVFVALEQRRTLERTPPDEVAVSVVTLAELEVGVLVADDDVRAIRMDTLIAVRERAGCIRSTRTASHARTRSRSASSSGPGARTG